MSTPSIALSVIFFGTVAFVLTALSAMNILLFN